MSLIPSNFHYLHDAQECWREDRPTPCVICQLSRPGYYFINIHEEGYDEFHVCEPCLISGRLSERELHVNDVDVDSVRQQLQARHPEQGEEEREVLLNERTTEVEQRTPAPMIRNTFTWPAHCGDYMVFFRQVDAADLNRLAPGGDGWAFLASHVRLDYEVDKSFLANVWKDRLLGFLRFYLWQCPQCAEYLLTCDAD